MKKFAFFGAKIGQKHVSVPFFDAEQLLSALRARFLLPTLRRAFRCPLCGCAFRCPLLFLPIFFRSGRFLPNLCTFCAVFFIPCYDSGEVEERYKEGTEKKEKFLLQSALLPMGGREREGFPHGERRGRAAGS